MMRGPATLLIACALLLPSTAALGRAPVTPPTASELRAIVETLTAPDMDGRRAGTPGGERATERLVAWLGAAGLRPGGDSGTFLQSFTVAPGPRLGPASTLELGGRVLKAGVEGAPPRGSRRGGGSGPPGFGGHGRTGAPPHKTGVPAPRGAHWDHLGASGGAVYHGADDNASGTAVVVGLARAFAAAGGTRRTLVFVLFGGEELGLIGSGHYVGHAARPLAQTVAMLNFDMVGRMRDDTLTIGGVDSGDRLRAATADAARAAGVNADLRGTPFSPSDHTRFYAAGTPVPSLHTGGHDDYHRPGDTADKLNVDGMARVAAIGACLLTPLDDGARPGYAKLTPPARRRGRPGSAAFLGVGGGGHGGDGARLAHGVPGSAAERAGLRDGDVLVRVDGVSVDRFEALRTAIRARQPGDTVRLVYLRDGRDHETSATLERSQE